MTQIEVVDILIADLKMDGSTQMRYKMDAKKVTEYAEAMKDGALFPPVVVFAVENDGNWLVDGFHRVAGRQEAGFNTINAEIRQGSRRDAIIYSLSANSAHGLARTNDDKRKAVVFALRDPEIKQMTERKIADLCGVTQPFVNKVKRELNPGKSKANPDNRYQLTNPAEIAASMSEDERNNFIADYIHRSTWVSDSEPKTLERFGLITQYESRAIEWQPLAQEVFNAAIDGDKWLQLEQELMAWNRENLKLNIYRFGQVKPALTQLFEAAQSGQGWVATRKIDYKALDWVRLLVATGYAEAQRVHYTNQRGSEDFWDFAHITIKGVERMGIEPPFVAMTPVPTAEDILQVLADEHAAYNARQLAEEQKRQANLDPAKEAERERNSVKLYLTQASWYIKNLKYHPERENITALYEELIELVSMDSKNEGGDE